MRRGKRMDVETILLCAVIAVTGAVGVVAGAAAFLGVSLQECSAALVAGGGCALGGIFWGILLIFNSSMWVKRS